MPHDATRGGVTVVATQHRLFTVCRSPEILGRWWSLFLNVPRVCRIFSGGCCCTLNMDLFPWRVLVLQDVADGYSPNDDVTREALRRFFRQKPLDGSHLLVVVDHKLLCCCCCCWGRGRSSRDHFSAGAREDINRLHSKLLSNRSLLTHTLSLSLFLVHYRLLVCVLCMHPPQ